MSTSQDQQHVGNQGRPSFYERIDQAAKDPTWPPLPTMSGATADQRPDLEGEYIELQPRGGTSQPQPGVPDEPGLPSPRPSSVPPASPATTAGFQAAASRPLEFPAPACGKQLVTTFGNTISTPGPCPFCESTIVAPHVLKSRPTSVKGKSIYRPDRSKANPGMPRRATLE